MFTGIIEEIGVVRRIDNHSQACALSVTASKVLEGTEVGDSIAVNGICVTTTFCSASEFRADIMNETRSRTALALLGPGSRVNLERAMPASGRFGGHIVAGHVDGVGVIRKISGDGHAAWFQIDAKEHLRRYMIEKGSIAIDGISLTIAALAPDGFLVSVIPHTFQNTILNSKRIGDMVNLETDCLGKYVESLMHGALEQRTLAHGSLAQRPQAHGSLAQGPLAQIGLLPTCHPGTREPTSRLTPELLERYGF